MPINKNLNDNSSLPDGDLRDLVQKNLELTQELHVMMKKVNNFIFWSRIGGFLKFIIIFLPLILGYVYLTPLLKNVIQQYQDLLGMKKNASEVLPGINLNSLPPELLKMIQKK